MYKKEYDNIRNRFLKNIKIKALNKQGGAIPTFTPVNQQTISCRENRSTKTHVNIDNCAITLLKNSLSGEKDLKSKDFISSCV